MQPVLLPLVAVELIEPVRFAKADAEFNELLGKRLPLPVDGPFADLLRGARPVPAASIIPPKRTEPSVPAVVLTLSQAD